MPWSDTKATTKHFGEANATIDLDVHAVLLLDQAGYHGSADFIVPVNVTLIPMASPSPELNPIENGWWFTRDNWLSSPVFAPCNNIVDHCCGAWNKLTSQPWKIMMLEQRNGPTAFDRLTLVEGSLTDGSLQI